MAKMKDLNDLHAKNEEMKKESETRKQNIFPSIATLVSEGATYERNKTKEGDHFTRMLKCIENIYVLHGMDNKLRDDHIKDLNKVYTSAFSGFLSINGMGKKPGEWSSYNKLLHAWREDLKQEANQRDPLLPYKDRYAEALIQQYKDFKANNKATLDSDRIKTAKGLGKQNINNDAKHNFSNQPKEITCNILQFLDTKSLCRMAQVNKQMNDLATNNDKVWDVIRSRHEKSESKPNNTKFTKKIDHIKGNRTIVKDAYAEIKAEKNEKHVSLSFINTDGL